MHIHVCPLPAMAETVRESGASHLLTLLGPADMIAARPDFAHGRHLRIAVNDIAEPEDGLVAADETHVAEIVQFALGWDRKRPMVIHCWAGISRSTAAALIALAAINGQVPERAIAARLREAAPFAKPNPRLVAVADAVLGRDGRLAAAVGALPEAGFLATGKPFRLPAILDGA